MRAKGIIAFQFLKTRSSDGVGKTINLNWSAKTLRITSNKTGTSLNFTPKTVKQEENKSEILNVFNT